MDLSRKQLLNLHSHILNQVDLVEYHNGEEYIASSFEDWCDKMRDNTCPDMGRKLLYYVLQPLHDSIMKENFTTDRSKVVEVFDEIFNIGVKYLRGYYLGTPNVELLYEISSIISPISDYLPNYYCKTRNADRNGVYNTGMLSYIKKFIDYSLETETIPDLILACACGGFEVSMALAGVCEIPIEVIRYSKRRHDSETTIIKEHEDRVKSSVNGKFTLIIDDYVCDGVTMRETMTTISTLSPSKLMGSSVCGNRSHSSKIKNIVDNNKFKLYEWSDIQHGQ